MSLTDEDYHFLLRLSRTSIDHGLIHDAPLFLNPKSVDKKYHTMGGSFISLLLNGQNRGCIGNYDNSQKLYFTVLQNSYKSAFQDERFPPINQNLFDILHIELHHILDRGRDIKVHSIQDLKNKIESDDTLYIEHNGKSSVMLSLMQIKLGSLEEFIIQTRSKSTIPNTVDWNQIKIKLYKTYYTKPLLLKTLEPCKNLD